MEVLWQELTAGLADFGQIERVLLRIIAATLLGAAVGFERERAGKPAGLRTHILVCLGTAIVVLACAGSRMDLDGLSRVIQGIVTGIGFIGAGSILKINEERDIQGLTTAAGLWMTAAIGVAVGLGTLGLALISTGMTLIVLWVLRVMEARALARAEKRTRRRVSLRAPVLPSRAQNTCCDRDEIVCALHRLFEFACEQSSLCVVARRQRSDLTKVDRIECCVIRSRHLDAVHHCEVLDR